MGFLRLCFDVVAVIGWVAMLVRVGSRPASRWRHGWLSKIGCLAVVVVMSNTVAGWWIPFGAIVVWWRLPSRDDEFELPMADGRKVR